MMTPRRNVAFADVMVSIRHSERFGDSKQGFIARQAACLSLIPDIPCKIWAPAVKLNKQDKNKCLETFHTASEICGMPLQPSSGEKLNQNGE